MMIKKTTLSIFLMMILNLVSLSSWGRTDSNVELEWEEIPQAYSYDLEVKSTRKTFKFSVDKPRWAGRLSPGFFKMRLRARDKRKVPGEWSEYQEFKVFLDSPKLLNPVSGSIIASNKNDVQTITLTWEKVFAAKKYNLDIQGLGINFQKKIQMTENSYTLELPVASKFKITIQAENEVLTSHPDKDLPTEFIVSGKKVPAVKLTAPESLYVREIKWNKPENAQAYAYTLEKINPKTKKFEIVEDNKEWRSEAMPFRAEWPGGKYKIQVKAIANYRPSSDATSLIFDVKDGDRSVRAEELARLRESIDRLSGWFGLASYLVNSVQYENLNYDQTGTQVPFNAIGGTLRAGIGHVTIKNKWGYFVAAESSTLDVQGFGQVSYNMLEINSIYKTRPNDAGEFRQTAGLVYKELPDLSSNFAGTRTINATVSAFGFRYGVEYWLAVTPKLGLQANAHLFPLIQGQKTTNGQDFIPSTSMQAGFLASYRFNKNLTVLGGYAYRADQMQYKTGSTPQFPNPASDKNSISLKGHYLNLLLEYQL